AYEPVGQEERLSGIAQAIGTTADEHAQGDIEVPRLAYQWRQQQPGRYKTYAHLDHHPWPTAIHQSADKRTEPRRDEEPEGERSGRRAPLPAKLVEDGREEQ